MVAGSTPPWCEYEVHINVQKDSHQKQVKEINKQFDFIISKVDIAFTTIT